MSDDASRAPPPQEPHTPTHTPTRAPPHSPTRAPPLTDAEIGELQALLDTVPAPLEPFDVSVLDGLLAGIVVQPALLAESRWLAFVTDAEGRPLPATFDAARLHALARRRHGELAAAVARRDWFDPWVFEFEGEGDAAYPWVAGFATALELFPQLAEGGGPALVEPLALLYRHLEADDLEDADELLAAIAELEPAEGLAEAVDDLVRGTLLLADVAAALSRSPPPAGRRRR